MRKELKPVHENVSCDVCGRTILKGERTEGFLAPGGERKQVCELCLGRAEHAGWIRERAHGDLPAALLPREPRRSGLFTRLRKRLEEPVAAEGDGGEAPAEEEGAFDAHPPPAPAAPRSRPKDPRHVRGIPTNAEVKVERALEFFNGSEHPRTIAGIARTLGPPWVAAQPDPEAPREVIVVVAWELSWYRYRIDLADSEQPVLLLEKGEELGELGGEEQDWNGTASADGTLTVGVGSNR
jgi:hypothetical protein